MMKKIILPVILFSLICLGIFFVLLVINVEHYPMDVYIVEDEMGFNLDEDKIHFGNLPLYGGGAYRELSITNVYDKPVKVFLSDSGEIDEYVFFEVDGKVFEKYNFVLDVNETKSYKIIFVNNNVPLGHYEGDLRIIVSKVFKFV